MNPGKPSAPPLAPTLSRLLYVEDDPTLTLLTRISLERVGGFTVKTCASGAEALAEVEAFAPDLILLDVMMPGMDGPATLAAMREIPALTHVPIVFMTARVQGEELVRYRELGAADVIGKPYDPVKLPELVREIWERCRGPVDLARLEQLRTVVGEAEFRRVAETFLADLARRITAMVQLNAAGDQAALVVEAHTLKGTAGSYGFAGVSTLAKQLETACAGGDGAAVAGALDALSVGIRESTARVAESFGLEPKR